MPDVFAAGDVAAVTWPSAASWFQMRLWRQARAQGLFAAQCMAGVADELSSGMSFEVCRPSGVPLQPPHFSPRLRPLASFACGACLHSFVRGAPSRACVSDYTLRGSAAVHARDALPWVQGGAAGAVQRPGFPACP